MMSDGYEIAVTQAMLAHTPTVYKTTVRAVQIDDHPARISLHEQVLESAEVRTVEADIAARVAAQNHARAAQRDLGELLTTARDDQMRGLHFDLRGIPELNGIRHEGR